VAQLTVPLADALCSFLAESLEPPPVAGDAVQPVQHQAVDQLGIDAVESALRAGAPPGVVVVPVLRARPGALASQALPALAAADQS
jgi:hypothetical protein